MAESAGTSRTRTSRAERRPPRNPDLANRREMIRSVGGSGLARFIVLPVSAILGIVVTRLIIENYGTDVYAQYALLVGLGALIPFADLGISAAIVNAVAGADDPRTDDHLRRTLVTSLRVLAGCSFTVILIVVAIYAVGAWPVLLGDGLTQESGSLVATLCLGIFGLNIMISYGQRILASLGLNALVVLLGGLQTPIVLGVLVMMIVLGLDGSFIAVAAYAATTVICGICIVLASRRISPMLRTAYSGAWRVRSVRGTRVFNVAWPMLVTMVAAPIAMQSDRLVLGHVSTVEELARYSLAAQIFMPIFAVVTSAGFALWPVFARARASGVKSPLSPFTMAFVFGAVAAAASLVMALASGWLSDVATGGRITLDIPLLAAFAVLMVLQSARYPFGAYLTDASGLRFQAFWVVAMLPLNLGLSLLLAPLLGAVGPLIGSIVGVLVCQLIPNWWLVARRVARDKRDRRAVSE